MKFQFSDSLQRILLAAGIAHDNAAAEAEKLAAEFPDAAPFKDKFLAWVTLNASTQLTPEHLTELAAIIVRDVVALGFQSDPKAFTGGA